MTTLQPGLRLNVCGEGQTNDGGVLSFAVMGMMHSPMLL
jgi:hypothetical protein